MFHASGMDSVWLSIMHSTQAKADTTVERLELIELPLSVNFEEVPTLLLMILRSEECDYE